MLLCILEAQKLFSPASYFWDTSTRLLLISEIPQIAKGSALSQYGTCHLKHQFIMAPSSCCHFIGRNVIYFVPTIIRGPSKLWKFVNSCMAKLNAILTNS